MLPLLLLLAGIGAEGQDVAATEAVTFELLVVGPDGKPVPRADIELRIRPLPEAEQIRQGTFVKKGAYGVFATADDQGRLVLQLPRRPSSFNVSIKTPGYGPYWANFSSDERSQEIPARFTAELESGWSVGGVVVDERGQPVAGVKVSPSIEYKKPPGDLSQLGVGTNLTTDAEGRWRFDSVPASKSAVHVSFSHPAFRPLRQSLPRDGFGIESGERPTTRLALDRGLTVTGTITDAAGQPIVGALVRAKFLNDIREAKTGEDGVYRLSGCEPRSTRVVVSAKRKATDMAEVRVEPEMPAVDFQMQPGGTVRIRVVDEKNNPVPKARIFFQRWRGRFEYFEFDHISQYANEQGVWEWREAPLDLFEADICRPGGMQLGRQALIARDEEYVFQPPPALVVNGKVVDAQTRQPIPRFMVVPGVRSQQPQWHRGEQFTATQGKFQLKKVHDAAAHLIRIEAEGYQAAISRDIQNDEGTITIDFELKPGIDVTAKVLTPDGKPADKARVALGIAGSQINVTNGRIREDSTYCARQDASEAGQFRFPPQDGPFQLVIVHASGYAHVHGSPDEKTDTIRLVPWARVEGVFRVGKETAANVPITLNAEGLHSYGEGQPSIFTDYETTTGKDGRYAFERVIPGSARIGRRILLMVNEGAVDITSSCMVPASLTSGETTRLDLGGSGRPVIGTLQAPPAREEPLPWQFALVSVELDLADPPMPPEPNVPADVAADPARRAAWLLQWRKTPAGQAWTAWQATVEAIQRLRDERPYFTASVKRDGTFRIDDVPAGSYVLSVRVDRNGRFGGGLSRKTFAIPALRDGRSDQPLDLGVLTLEK